MSKKNYYRKANKFRADFDKVFQPIPRRHLNFLFRTNVWDFVAVATVLAKALDCKEDDLRRLVALSRRMCELSRDVGYAENPATLSYDLRRKIAEVFQFSIELMGRIPQEDLGDDLVRSLGDYRSNIAERVKDYLVEEPETVTDLTSSDSRSPRSIV